MEWVVYHWIDPVVGVYSFQTWLNLFIKLNDILFNNHMLSRTRFDQLMRLKVLLRVSLKQAANCLDWFFFFKCVLFNSVYIVTASFDLTGHMHTRRPGKCASMLRNFVRCWYRPHEYCTFWWRIRYVRASTHKRRLFPGFFVVTWKLLHASIHHSRVKLLFAKKFLFMLIWSPVHVWYTFFTIRTILNVPIFSKLSCRDSFFYRAGNGPFIFFLISGFKSKNLFFIFSFFNNCPLLCIYSNFVMLKLLKTSA